MDDRDTAELLKRHGIHPSAQRVAIARYVLRTGSHPSADRVWTKVKETIPVVSRATVYNTLNLLVKKGLLKNVHVPKGGSVFDPKVERHHHFVDEDSGEIQDIPWERLEVRGLGSLRELEITEYVVFVRGRRRRRDG